jgi:hypothetical protein
MGQQGAQGNDPPDGSQGSGAPEGFTEEQLSILNRMMTGRLKDFAKSQTKSIEDLVTKALEPISGVLEKLTAGNPGGDANDKDKPKTPPGDINEHPVVKGLTKRLAELEQASKAREDELAAEKAKVKDKELRQELSSHLAKAGISGTFAEHAIGYLVDSKKLVSYDEDGNMVFKDTKGSVDLKTGITSWAKSEDGKLYQPPRGAGGSGERPTGAGAAGNRPNGQSGTVSEQEIGNALAGLMGGSISQ